MGSSASDPELSVSDLAWPLLCLEGPADIQNLRPDLLGEGSHGSSFPDC